MSEPLQEFVARNYMQVLNGGVTKLEGTAYVGDIPVTVSIYRVGKDVRIDIKT